MNLTAHAGTELLSVPVQITPACADTLRKGI